MADVPIYVKEGDKTFIEAELRHLGEIPIIFKPFNEIDGIYDGVYKGYIKELNGFVVIENRLDNYLVSSMADWREFAKLDGERWILDVARMQEFNDYDTVIDHIKRTYVAQPIKQTKLTRLA